MKQKELAALLWPCFTKTDDGKYRLEEAGRIRLMEILSENGIHANIEVGDFKDISIGYSYERDALTIKLS